jgi:hypothetical protein
MPCLAEPPKFAYCEGLRGRTGKRLDKCKAAVLKFQRMNDVKPQ